MIGAISLAAFVLLFIGYFEAKRLGFESWVAAVVSLLLNALGFSILFVFVLAVSYTTTG